MTEYVIEATEKPAESHWEHMHSVEDHLRGELDFMAACLALADDESLNEAQRQAISDTGYEPDEAPDPSEIVSEWPLSIERTRWDDGTLDRMEVVLGTGGPHVELVFRYSRSGGLSSLTLARYWSQSDEATVSYGEGLDVAERFADAFLNFE